MQVESEVGCSSVERSRSARLLAENNMLASSFVVSVVCRPNKVSARRVSACLLDYRHIVPILTKNLFISSVCTATQEDTRHRRVDPRYDFENIYTTAAVLTKWHRQQRCSSRGVPLDVIEVGRGPRYRTLVRSRNLCVTTYRIHFHRRGVPSLGTDCPCQLSNTIT